MRILYAEDERSLSMAVAEILKMENEAVLKEMQRMLSD